MFSGYPTNGSSILFMTVRYSLFVNAEQKCKYINKMVHLLKRKHDGLITRVPQVDYRQKPVTTCHHMQCSFPADSTLFICRYYIVTLSHVSLLRAGYRLIGRLQRCVAERFESCISEWTFFPFQSAFIQLPLSKALHNPHLLQCCVWVKGLPLSSGVTL